MPQRHRTLRTHLLRLPFILKGRFIAVAVRFVVSDHTHHYHYKALQGGARRFAVGRSVAAKAKPSQAHSWSVGLPQRLGGEVAIEEVLLPPAPPYPARVTGQADVYKL